MQATYSEVFNVDIFAAHASFTGDGQINELYGVTDKAEQPVLVPNVEMVKQPEWVKHRTPIPSRVRLQSLDECHRGLPKGEYLSFPSGLFVSDGFGGRRRRRATVPDWELGTGRRATVGDFELPRGVVKRRPEVVNDIADDQAPLKGDGARDAGTPDTLASLSVVISDNAVWIESSEVRVQTYEVLEVLLGPLNLGPAASEVWWWHA